MKPLNNQTDATLPSCLPLLMHSAVMDFCPEPGTMRFCDNYIIQPLLSPHSGVMLCTITIPTMTLSRRHVEPLTEVQTLFWKPREAEEKISHFDFCPASGRLCVMTKKDVIHVVDYLLPIEGAYSVSISIIQRPDCQWCIVRNSVIPKYASQNELSTSNLTVKKLPYVRFLGMRFRLLTPCLLLQFLLISKHTQGFIHWELPRNPSNKALW